MESEKCKDYVMQTKSQVKEGTYYICLILQKQTYQNNMEPEGTSQQESGGVQSFLEMENLGIRSFQKTNTNK